MPHKGVCIGGPMAGQTITTRSDCGFVAVDKPASAAWLYYPDVNGRFVVDTRPDPSLLDADGTRALDMERAMRAQSEKGLDVIALPGDGVEDDGEDAQAVDLAPDGPEVVVSPGDAREGQD